MRADALSSDDCQPSNFAWMEMRSNPVDIVVGPSKTCEDQFFGHQASCESCVLIKDQAWSARLARFAKYLPELQRGLPVPDRYKAEKPGSAVDLKAYFAIHHGGDAHVRAKTIAINLPNDEQVQLKQGKCRLQRENVMQAKFDKIMLPITHELSAEDQQENLSFDTFFQHTMFQEDAHGLGIKNVVGKSGLHGKGQCTQGAEGPGLLFRRGQRRHARPLHGGQIGRQGRSGQVQTDG
jgi:hypothetical protein